jgi:hypothetical protein
MAFRTALEQAGLPLAGDLEGARGSLGMGAQEEPGPEAGGAQRLALAEKTVAQVAAYLRALAPDRTWGF